MDVLKATREGPVKPTYITNRNNISWIVLQKNLQALKEAGLVREGRQGSDRTDYAITEKGMTVLNEYDELVRNAMTCYDALLSSAVKGTDVGRTWNSSLKLESRSGRTNSNYQGNS